MSNIGFMFPWLSLCLPFRVSISRIGDDKKPPQGAFLSRRPVFNLGLDTLLTAIVHFLLTGWSGPCTGAVQSIPVNMMGGIIETLGQYSVPLLNLVSSSSTA